MYKKASAQDVSYVEKVLSRAMSREQEVDVEYGIVSKDVKEMCPEVTEQVRECVPILVEMDTRDYRWRYRPTNYEVRYLVDILKRAPCWRLCGIVLDGVGACQCRRQYLADPLALPISYPILSTKHSQSTLTHEATVLHGLKSYSTSSAETCQLATCHCKIL